MKISVIHPSRARPQEAFSTIKNWLAGYCPTDGDRIEWILSLDENDEHLNEYREKCSNLFGVRIIINDNKTAIEAINKAAECSHENLLIVVSDDFNCTYGWNLDLEHNLQGKEDFCVKTDDGHQSFIITIPIMDRKYYERTGWIYFPEYKHLFSDSDMSCTAWMLGRYIKIDMKFPHLHHSFGKREKDEIDIKNENTHEQGRLLFDKRKAINFGIEFPIPLKSEFKIV